MVVDGVEEALRRARSGRAVVLIVAPHAGPVLVEDAGPGRIAVFVGPLDDPATWDAAEAMATELFGDEVFRPRSRRSRPAPEPAPPAGPG
jgi:hypothetical protein